MTELLATMPSLRLTSDMVVRFEAIDPSTGAAVAGVNISNAVIYADDSAGPEDAVGDIGPYMLVPGPTSGGISGAPVGKGGQ